MKLSEVMKYLQEIQERIGDISIPKNALEAIYMPLYHKKKNGDLELSIDYLKSLDNELFEYLVRELEIEPTKKVIDAYNKAYDSHRSYGQEQIYFEFISLLDLLDIKYKEDWE